MNGKLYLVAMDVYIELPRGKENYILRKLLIRALRKGRYDGVIVEDNGMKILGIEEVYLTKLESIIYALVGNQNTRNYDFKGES